MDTILENAQARAIEDLKHKIIELQVECLGLKKEIRQMQERVRFFDGFANRIVEDENIKAAWEEFLAFYNLCEK